MKPVTLISGAFFHHLDHLAPLAYLLKCPLFVDDPSVYEVGKKYYPEVNLFFKTIDLFELSHHFDLLIVSTKHASKEMKACFEALNLSLPKICFCPHGQSDKGLVDPRMRAIQNQEIALIYGQRQWDLLKTLPFEVKNDKVLLVGNYRAFYYEKHRTFYDALVEREIMSQFPRGKTILYAPTWNDLEYQTTFFDQTDKLLEVLPDHLNLLIKLHPLLERSHPAEFFRALSFHQMKPNIQVLFEFPLIYPLLNRIDLYLGDYSAIGYDFLYFDRPLFFIGKEKTPLYDVGIQIASGHELFTREIFDTPELQRKRRALYKYAFTPFQKSFLDKLD